MRECPPPSLRGGKAAVVVTKVRFIEQGGGIEGGVLVLWDCPLPPLSLSIKIFL